MAKGEGNPQLKDGFSRIANEILEAIARTPLSDSESRCVHYLWRQTYGWINSHGESKKLDNLSYSQWEKGTALSRRNVIRTLNKLTARNIILKNVIKPKGRSALILWGFQKRYYKWNGIVSPETLSTLEIVSQLPPFQQESIHELVSDKAPIQDQLVAEMTPDTHEIVSPGTELVAEMTPELVAEMTPTKDILKDKVTKDILLLQHIGATKKEISFMQVLATVPGWVYEPEEDLGWLRDFIFEYPAVVSIDLKQCRDYNSDKPTSKGRWKNRFHQWLKHKLKYEVNKEVVHGGEKPKFKPDFSGVKVIDGAAEDDNP